MRKKEFSAVGQRISGPLKVVVIAVLFLIFACIAFLAFMGVKVVENPATKKPPVNEIFPYHGGREKG